MTDPTPPPGRPTHVPHTRTDSPPSDGTPAAPTGALLGPLRPRRDVPASLPAVLTAVAVGLLAALVLPDRDLGLGTALVLLAAGAAAVAAAVRTRRTPYLLGSVGLAVALVSTVAVRDAAWISALCVLAAAAVTVVALLDARSVVGVAAAALAVPLAAVRGWPWLGRSLRTAGRTGGWLPALRTGVLSAVLVAVFVALFASADALFATWVDAVVPDLSLGSLRVRLLVLVLVAGTTLAATYVSLDPPAVDLLAQRPVRPLARRFEWLVPAGLVLAVSGLFVAAQLTVMFGGHAYLRATTGLTYAEHVHQGFGQLTVATVLTLGVVGVTARRAPRGSAPDRLLLRVLLGALCGVTLVVVASALWRMHLYEQAYGFTGLRLLVSVFEGWLGLLLVLVLVAGVRLRGWWLPRATVLTGAGALLGLALLNPDGYVAAQNVQRYAETGRADWYYLAGLSDDAVPALRRLPPDAQDCVFGPPRPRHDDWLEWNLGRARAGTASLEATGGCIAR
ncbi:DUF4153 domain-containing protein [Nocardioides mesophilus]|uniref:DUF4173 domain-containing protein n=1 Tax=Nocardioides mesophilus TaxID=433659 RepID=A0A7G9R7B9_9ACTN|nr:DUF4173 domain-containing protein [Nocardioides mesophilus]QNN51494.1 DUF4173 domain-containing protein [Nocardioides mesophilus]